MVTSGDPGTWTADNIEKLKEEITCVTIRSWVFPIVWRVTVKT
jgi:hypothetical protein